MTIEEVRKCRDAIAAGYAFTQVFPCRRVPCTCIVSANNLRGLPADCSMPPDGRHLEPIELLASA